MKRRFVVLFVAVIISSLMVGCTSSRDNQITAPTEMAESLEPGEISQERNAAGDVSFDNSQNAALNRNVALKQDPDINLIEEDTVTDDAGEEVDALSSENSVTPDEDLVQCSGDPPDEISSYDENDESGEFVDEVSTPEDDEPYEDDPYEDEPYEDE